MGKEGKVSVTKTSSCKDKRNTSDILPSAVVPPTQINPFCVEIVTQYADATGKKPTCFHRKAVSDDKGVA